MDDDDSVYDDLWLAAMAGILAFASVVTLTLAIVSWLP
jgi:hypothetical protein